MLLRRSSLSLVLLTFAVSEIYAAAYPAIANCSSASVAYRCFNADGSGTNRENTLAGVDGANHTSCSDHDAATVLSNSYYSTDCADTDSYMCIKITGSSESQSVTMTCISSSVNTCNRNDTCSS